MTLVLVVVNDFSTYRRGMLISDPVTINAIRADEYANQVVLVSDTIIPPPVVPDAPNYAEVLANYQALVAQIGDQQLALNAATALNAQQNAAIAGQLEQIGALTVAVNTLAAQIANPNGGTPVPPDVADDLPLSENDGDILVTNAGGALAGDIR